MTILEKISSTGKNLGIVGGALLGGVIPYKMMKHELTRTENEKEKNEIKKKYLSRILLSGGAGGLAGGYTGTLISHRKNLKNIGSGSKPLNKKYYNDYILPTVTGSALGSLPGMYDFYKAQTEEEKEKAKKKLLTGLAIGGTFGSGYKKLKNLDKGLK